jgi:hypothetical protein
MSYDLTLYIPYKPLSGEGSVPIVHLYDRLHVGQDYAILGQLTDMIDDVPTTIRGQTLSPETWVVEYNEAEERMMETREDAWGNELTFVYAEDLKRLRMPERISPWNRAIMAFINALPNNTPIILMWR